jgi:hypothetical protein
LFRHHLAMRTRPVLFAGLVALAVVAGACSSDGGGTASTTAGGSPSSSAGEPGTSAGSGTTSGGSDCPKGASTSAQSSADPLAMSSLVGQTIRFAVYTACTDRVVIELQGQGDFPGWTVDYSDGPPPLGESDEAADVDGGAVLVARLGSWMTTMDGEGYDGPREIKTPGLQAVRELELVGNDEGVMRWAIGLDEERPFKVATLPDPPRLVIDVQTG